MNIWGFVEAFVCVGMMLGLTVLFRRLCSTGGRVLGGARRQRLRGVSRHWFIVVAIQAAILGLAVSATGSS